MIERSSPATRPRDDDAIAAAVQASAAGRRLARRQAVTDDVYEVLVDMLMNHVLPPESRLNIDALTRSLGVSSTPIREALARIESEGLVVKEPHRGYTVAPLIDLAQLREHIDVRSLLEPSAAAAAARNASDEEAAALAALARSGGEGDSGTETHRGGMTYDALFHDRIAELAGNATLRDMLQRLHAHLHMYRLYHHAGQAAATWPEHVAIASAIERHEPEAAAAAMQQHLATAFERVRRVLEG